MTAVEQVSLPSSPTLEVDVTAWRHRPNDAPSNKTTLKQGSCARVPYLAFYTRIA